MNGLAGLVGIGFHENLYVLRLVLQFGFPFYARTLYSEPAFSRKGVRWYGTAFAGRVQFCLQEADKKGGRTGELMQWEYCFVLCFGFLYLVSMFRFLLLMSFLMFGSRPLSLQFVGCLFVVSACEKGL